MTVNKSKRNVAIMCIRIVAMLFIFTDHAVAYTDIPYKAVIIQITNSANLIFLYISGFLYGGKSIDDIKGWIKKRILRLWIPYFIFVFIYFLVAGIYGGGLKIMKPFLIYTFVLQGFLGTEGGPGTLWFMTLLVLCYCLIPLLQRLRDYMMSVSNSRYWALGVTALIVIQQLLLAFHCNLTLDFGHPGSWYLVALFMFSCGYFSNRKITSSGIPTRKLIIWTVSMCVAMTIRVISQSLIDGTILYNKVISIWTNFILDIWIIYFIYFVVDRMQRFFDCELIRQGDKISYPFYLVHATVLGICFGANISGLPLILVSFVLSIVYAYVLNFVSGKVISAISDRTSG